MRVLDREKNGQLNGLPEVFAKEGALEKVKGRIRGGGQRVGCYIEILVGAPLLVMIPVVRLQCSRGKDD